MKKILVFLAVLTFSLNTVNAMTEAELKEKLTQSRTVNGAKFEATDQEKTLIERYLNQYEVSSNDADYVVNKLNAVFDILKDSGKKTFQELSSADKQRIVAIVADVSANTDFDCAIVDGRFVLYVPNPDNPNEKEVFYKSPVKPIAQTNRDLLIAGLGIISALGIALAFKKVKNA